MDYFTVCLEELYITTKTFVGIAGILMKNKNLR
jgi:hypothetical protein